MLFLMKELFVVGIIYIILAMFIYTFRFCELNIYNVTYTNNGSGPDIIGC